MKKIPSLSILYWLKPNKQKDADPFLYCRLTVDGVRAEISLQRTVPRSMWVNGSVVGKGAASKQLEDFLSLFKTNVLQHFNNMLASDKEVTAETLKNAILGIVNEEERPKTFSEMAQLMNKEFSEKVKIKKRSQNTLNKHIISQNFFFQYLKDERKVDDIILEKLNLSYCYDFEHYLSIKHKHSHNTFMKHIKNVKQVLIFAKKKCQLKQNPFDGFKCSYHEPKIVLLEQHEIDKLYNHNFTIKRLEQVRDCYIFCCYTAYAFTDLMSLTMDNIIMSLDKELWICKDRTKTDTAENVLLLPIPKDIIEKYNDHECRKKGFLLPQISLQNYNGYLKEIATICGIEKDLTSHTARFTFATTVTLENDVPIESVSIMMGHKTIRTTQRYAKVTKRKLTNNMQALRMKLIQQPSNNESIISQVAG